MNTFLQKNSADESAVFVAGDEEYPSEASTLFIFPRNHCFRTVCHTIVCSKKFQWFILFSILLNSLLLAVDQPRYSEPDEVLEALYAFEIVFTVLFTFEMLIKMVDSGVIGHRFAYLRNPWNVLDFSVVVTSILSLSFHAVGNYSALRVIRVLRPLRTLSRVKVLKDLVGALFRAMPIVVDNVLFLAFVMILFAIAAVQFWAGQLGNRCYINELPDADMYRPLANKTPVLLQGHGGSRPCGGLNKCGNVTDHRGNTLVTSCESHPELYTERFMNYDNFGAATFLLLKVVVLDNWVDQLNDAMDMSGRWSAALFFLLLTLVGSIFCINLFLAILTKGYADQAHEGNGALDRNPGFLAEVSREKNLLQDFPVDYMDCGVQVAVADDQLVSVSYIGHCDVVFAARKATSNHSARAIRLDGGDAEETPRDAHASVSASVTKRDMNRSDFARDDNAPYFPKDAGGLTIGSTSTSLAHERKVTFAPIASIPSESVRSGTPSGHPSNRVCKADLAISHASGIGTASVDVAHQFFGPGIPAHDSGGQGDLGSSHESSASGQCDENTAENAIVLHDPSRRSFMHVVRSDGIFSALSLLERTMDAVLRDDLRANWRKKMGDIVESDVVCVFMLSFNIVNVGILSADHHGADKTLVSVMGAVSVACTIVFALHLLAKIVAWGPSRTLAVGFNRFDLVMVLLSIPDIYYSGGESSMFSVLRAVRFVRVFRVLRTFESLQAITETLVSSWSSVSCLFCLILIFMYVYAVLGMQLYGTKYGRTGTEAREGFDTIWASFLTCFLIIAGDGWTEKMLLPMESGVEEQISSIMYFITLHMIVNYIFINLFIAIIVKRLNQTTQQLESDDIQMPSLMLPVYQGPLSLVMRTHLMATKVSRLHAPQLRSGDLVSAGHSASTVSEKVLSANAHGSKEASTSFGDFRDSHVGPCYAKFRQLWKMITKVQSINVVEDSLYLFSPQNKFRQWLLKLLGSTLFEVFITVNIFAGMVFLCFESVNNSPETTLLLDRANFFFTGVFCIEMCMKIVAFGWFFPKGETDESVQEPHQPAYFRDPWNWVDAVINVLSFASLRFTFFKSARSLRTIRLTIRNQKTKLIIVAMLQSVPHVLQALILVTFIFYILAIVGVQLFKGKFYECSDASVWQRELCNGTFAADVQGPVLLFAESADREWKRFSYHFDHLGASLLSLFVVAVGDDWERIMWQGVDATQPDHGPRKNETPWMALYFVIAYIFTNFFSFNIIIGVLINYFSKMKKKSDGSALLTPEQRLYVKARHTIDSIMFNDDMVPFDTPISHRVSKVLKFRLSGSSPDSLSLFEIGMTGVIILNTVVIASSHEGMKPWMRTAIDVVNNVVLGIFTCEMIAKLTAFGPRQYFASAWDRFDAFIVVIGFISIGLRAPSFSFIRVLRVIKLARRSSIESLLINVIRSFNSFVNVFALLVITFFVYAAAGVILWGPVVRNGALDDVNNFDNVPNAMFVLYQIAMTEGMAEYMAACSIEPPDCEHFEDGTDNCGNYAAATAYFLSFMIICTFTILQLFVAVVVEIFTDDFNDEDPIVLGFHELKKVWSEQVGAGVNAVHLYQFVAILPCFPIILTDLKYNYRPAEMIRLLAGLHLPIDSHYMVAYRDLVHAIAWRKYHIDVRSVGALINEAIFTFVSPSLAGSFTAAQCYAALLIQKRWVSHQHRAHEQNLILLRVSPREVSGTDGPQRKRYVLHRQSRIETPLPSNLNKNAVEGTGTSNGGDAVFHSTGGALLAPEPLFLQCAAFGEVDGNDETTTVHPPPKAEEASNPFASLQGVREHNARSRYGLSTHTLGSTNGSTRGSKQPAPNVIRTKVPVASPLRDTATDYTAFTPQGAVYVPGCSLYAFVPLIDDDLVGSANVSASRNGDQSPSYHLPAPDPTGIFNPEL